MNPVNLVYAVALAVAVAVATRFAAILTGLDYGDVATVVICFLVVHNNTETQKKERNQ